jgi:hypothetical protein
VAMLKNILLCVCGGLLLGGCISKNTNLIEINEQLNIIPSQCSIGDEFEISFPIPLNKKIEKTGIVHYFYIFYQYNNKKKVWEIIDEPKSVVGKSGAGGGFTFYKDYTNTLKTKSIKIKMLKEGLFLVKIKLNIYDTVKNKVICFFEGSTVLNVIKQTKESY